MKMKKILIAMVAIMAVLMAAACQPKPELTPEEMAKEALDGYIAGFGHVRVLGDIDHILKGEKVDDEPEVTAQTMTAGTIAFNTDKTELTIPLTLAGYDFDGHRNEGDPEPEKYTRTATGILTLVLTGTMAEDGTAFTATSYEMKDVAVDLASGQELGLASISVASSSIKGIFVNAAGTAGNPLVVNVAEGKAAAIADVTAPKFGDASGTVSVGDFDFSL